MNKSAYANKDYKLLARLARPYYPDKGPNSWEHIQDVRRAASKMVRKLYGRSLTPAEYAAIMMHDNTKREFGGENHGRMGAERAAKVLAAALSPKDLRLATEAIAVHDDNLPKFPSQVAEVLASGDANPPDPDWILNKAYQFNLRKHTPENEIFAHVLKGGARKYGTGGKFNAPGIYSRYYGEKLNNMRKLLDSLDEAGVQSRIENYRKAHGQDMGVVYEDLPRPEVT